MKIEIPDNVACDIQASVDRKKKELEKKAKEEEKQRKECAKAKKELQADRKKTIESAKKNLLSLNEFIKKEPLKSYLNLEETTGFPLWEEHFEGDTDPGAELFLRSDGVYRWVLDQSNNFHETYRNVKKITSNSLTMDTFERSGSPIIQSLAKWDNKKIIKYLGEQFTPI